jgi:hypothetical protein
MGPECLALGSVPDMLFSSRGDLSHMSIFYYHMDMIAKR